MSNTSGAAIVTDLLRRHANQRPEAAALWFEGRETSFAMLDRRSNQCAQAMLADGVRPGDRIATLTLNSDLFPVLWFGAIKARACLVPINTRLAPPEIAAIIRDSGARRLVFAQGFAELVETIAPECPGLGTLVQYERNHGRAPAFEAWLDAHEPTDPGLPAAPGDDVIQLYTSGTTGLPKGVPLTHAHCMAQCRAGEQMEYASWQTGKSALVALPNFHVAGSVVLLLALQRGTRAVIVREINPPQLARLIAEQRINYAFLTPTVIQMILSVPDAESIDFSALEHVFYGASPISEHLLARAMARFPAAFSQVYGMTEACGVVTALPPNMHIPGKLLSCGRPIPGVELRVIDPMGNDVPQGEVGEVAVRAPFVMQGYWNRPDATAAAIDEHGWYRTGDAGWLDRDGDLFIHDRVKDMIVSGGENVYPAEVENAIAGHPDVAEVAVIGVPDSRWGEAVKAIVVPKAATSPSEESVIAWARARIGGYKLPKSVDFVPTLPRNATGKVLRRALREPYWRGHTRNVS